MRKPDFFYTIDIARILKITLIALVAIIMLGIAAVGGYAIYTINTQSENIDTTDIYANVSQTSILYDDNGVEIDTVFVSGGNRDIIDIRDIPEDIKDAIIAIEDQKFYKHHGFNFIRIIGAIKDSVVSGDPISGTSTITQQLARNLYLADIKSERSFQRKILEAYYTVIIEKKFTKDQILEAYLNTVYFGFDSYGIQKAAENYFSKPAKELDLAECVALAALPQAPDAYALVKMSYENEENVLKENAAASRERRNTILSFMKENGTITKEEYDKVKADDISSHLKPQITKTTDKYSYFVDMAIDQVAEDLAEEKNITKDEAYGIIYNKGLKIYTTMDKEKQDIMTAEINNSSNYVNIGYLPKDNNGNVIDNDGNILLYKYSNIFNSDGSFTLRESDYSKDGNDIILKKGKDLIFYEAESNGQEYVSVEYRNMYHEKNGEIYFMKGGYLSIPVGYTTLSKDGNCVVSAQFMKDYPEFFNESEGNLKISSTNIQLNQKTIQPQAAAALMENETGQVKAICGGRGESGEMLYNRAANPRQPGSAIKPIAIYGPALQMSVDKVKEDEAWSDLDGSDGSRWGDYITELSVINDAPMTYKGKRWPKNAGGGYSGRVTVRKAIQQSLNIPAVKTYQQLPTDYIVEKLKANGITSLVEDGSNNDMNPAALALGGMVNGISPLELTAAYCTFPSKGVYKEPIFYNKVIDSNGNVILQKEAEQTQVFDKGVAFIMTDILQSAVTKGICKNARISGVPVGGKTGTTSDYMDIWFAGFTPKYTMALWEGNDYNIELTSGSGYAASFWATIMSRICGNEYPGEFPKVPSNVSDIGGGTYIVEGTYTLKEDRQMVDRYTFFTEEKITMPTESTEQSSSDITSEEAVNIDIDENE